MATATMATAAGAAALLYYTLNRKLHSTRSQDGEEDNDSEVPRPAPAGRNRVLRGPVQAPGTWLETISTLSETLRFTYSETLGKWPIGDLAFGINFLLKRQGNLAVASIYAGEDSLQLKGPEIIAELRNLLHLLTLCWHFSKKPFPLFLEETGYSQEDVLLQEPKAGILKPAFTILVDKKAKCFLLLIRGTHSIKDTLTAATGAIVPFHHTVLNEGGVSNVVLGYAHCGMVAASRWIAKLAAPCLTKGLCEYPDYKIKIVGHSLGGGTAALLTYALRELKEFSTATCVTFAPAACMTWELAESGADFITSVINGADLVPTFSAASVDDLRSEVTASAWLNDLRNQIEQTRILSTVYRSASALGSRLPSIASAKARVVGAGAYLRPVSNSTQVVMRRARSVAHAAWTRSPSLQLSKWSCMGARHRSTAVSNLKMDEDHSGTSPVASETGMPLLRSEESTMIIESTELPVSMSGGMEWTSELDYSCSEETIPCVGVDEDEGEDLMGHGRSEDRMTEEELWQQLEHELYRQEEGNEAEANEIREEEKAAVAEVTGTTSGSLPMETAETHRFYPPGKIMHLVTLYPEEPTDGGSMRADDDESGTVDSEVGIFQSSMRADDDDSGTVDSKVGIFQTARSLYGKLRLSQNMINDHFMPMYKRQMEQLISELEKETSRDFPSGES
ncbi:Mono-/di-acylglycerol lipase isoform 1 [Cinnamomum micranthum f. kanehirae]|uniref:Mono-/di-acylglycerol lipase isoform 1 n=1 Tax=Cinnamomum micranthum f. kanehirae TaxID=337451 RepID=A0A3S3N4P2_9MAGN|nr:Mono-/di-acylglycerol lipase isoform 1 [Cinnamomum micranthum f. kanehirae]